MQLHVEFRTKFPLFEVVSIGTGQLVCSLWKEHQDLLYIQEKMLF